MAINEPAPVSFNRALYDRISAFLIELDPSEKNLDAVWTLMHVAADAAILVHRTERKSFTMEQWLELATNVFVECEMGRAWERPPGSPETAS